MKFLREAEPNTHYFCDINIILLLMSHLSWNSTYRELTWNLFYIVLFWAPSNLISEVKPEPLDDDIEVFLPS